MERDVRQMIHYLKQDKECDRPFMISFSQGESYCDDAAVWSHSPRNRIICFVFASVQCDGWFPRALQSSPSIVVSPERGGMLSTAPSL